MSEAPTGARPRFDVTSVGETMLRLTPPAGRRLSGTDTLEVHFGGAESNVVAALARLGRACAWHGRVPTHALGDALLARLAAAGIDLSSVERVDDERLGLYFVDGVEDRGARALIYDRRDSAAAHLDADTLPWDDLLDTRIVHVTGITPALSPSCRRVVEVLLERAGAAGVAVSLDVNYRPPLWDAATAGATLAPLLGRVDVLICAARDATLLFDAEGGDEAILASLVERFGAPWTVLTLGANGAIGASRDGVVRQPATPTRVVDSVGGGDAFAAGVLDGWLDGSMAEGLRRGAALAARVLAQRGDMPDLGRDDLAAPRPS
jgi:2-dehydro-3-deoxygluconokinase